MNQEKMNIVIVGHVDHGKSTVIGRLLADTDSLPQGKLQQVKDMCAKNSKPFEYAFLLDALKDEQSQGITIDSARCFFKTEKRHYIVIDAPGHIEFLRNMVTGAARAEAALLVIDAKEGIQENSKRHGYLLSMLRIKQVSILVNKMDLVAYKESVYLNIKKDFTLFLNELQVEPVSFIPLSAREGDNVIKFSGNTSWYQGPSILEQLDLFQNPPSVENLPFRFPLQDIYKFTADKDDRRIFAGMIETGKVAVGDQVLFLPSGKSSEIKSIEGFHITKKSEAKAGEALGFTLNTQVYLKPGELMVKVFENKPKVCTQFRANVFWMGKAPLLINKKYKLKLACARRQVKLVKILDVIDASQLNSFGQKSQVDRHDVAECIFEVAKPLALDLTSEIETTGRFVIIDNFEIAGGGIVIEDLENGKGLEKYIEERELAWVRGAITPEERANQFQHHSKFILFTGSPNHEKKNLAKEVEKKLFYQNYNAYYMGLSNLNYGLDSDMENSLIDRNEYIRRLGELARIMTDSGQIFITTADDLDDFDIERLKLLNKPNEFLVINIGESLFNEFHANVKLDENFEMQVAVSQIFQMLKEKNVLEYYL